MNTAGLYSAHNGLVLMGKHILFLFELPSNNLADSSTGLSECSAVCISGFLPGFMNYPVILSGLPYGNAFLYYPSRTLLIRSRLLSPNNPAQVFASGVPWSMWL